MSEFVTSGDELELLIRLGRKRPMPFAFCPSVGEDDALFATHRKKPPEIIARVTRKQSGQTKVAFGTFTVEHKTLVLTLLKELPNIGRKLKKYLRRERLSLSIRILDISGNELESLDHVDEDGPQDPIMARFDDDVDDTGLDDETDSPDPEPEAGDLPDPILIARQLKALQPRLADLPGNAGEKLRAVLSGAVTLLRTGAVEKAAIYADAVETVLARKAAPVPQSAPLAPKVASFSQPTPAAPSAAAKSHPSRPAPVAATVSAGPPDPGTAALAQDLHTLKSQAETLPPETRDKVLAAVSHAAQQLRSGDSGAAAQTVATLHRVLGPEKPAPVDPKWTATKARLRPAVEAALAGTQGDKAAIKARFVQIEALGTQGRVDEALALVPELVGLLKAATTADEDITQEAALRRSLQRWDATRVRLNDEIARLKSSIDATVSGIEGMQQAAHATDRLFTYLDRLDTRLDDALDELERAPEGPQRDILKTRALRLIGEYRAELDGDFFRDVDDGNGFVPVKVRKTALAALERIGAALD